MYSPELIDIVLVSQLDMLVIVFALLLLPVFRCDCALCLRCYTVAFQPRGLYRAFVVSAQAPVSAEFEKRLNRTASRLPKTFIDKAIGDMRRRCRLLRAAEGGLFEEGGRTRRPL